MSPKELCAHPVTFPSPEGLGGIGRVVTLKQPMELKMLQFNIRTELELKHSELHLLL